MDLTYTASEAAFREELRTWLTQNPVGQKPSWDDGLIEWLIAWQGRLYDAGWAAVQWPTEHGGRGATLTESAIFFEEMARAGAPLMSLKVRGSTATMTAARPVDPRPGVAPPPSDTRLFARREDAGYLILENDL